MSMAAEIRDLIRKQNCLLGEMCELLRQGRGAAVHPLAEYLDRETRMEEGRQLMTATPAQQDEHNRRVLAEARRRHGKKRGNQ